MNDISRYLPSGIVHMNRIGCIALVLAMLSGCVTESSGSFTPDVSREQALNDYLQLSRGYLEQGDLDSARRHLQNAERFDSNNSEVHGIWALLYSRQGDTEHADESFRRALRLNSNDSQTRNNYAAFLYGHGRYQEAYSQLEIVVRDTNYRARSQAFENLGLAALRLEREAEAINAFSRALQLNPNQVRSVVELGDISFRQGNIPQARSYFQNYLTLEQFFNLRPSARSLWLGIRLARLDGNREQEREYANLLSGGFPNSFELQAYRQLTSNE